MDAGLEERNIYLNEETMRTCFTSEEFDEVENNAYVVGITVGTTTERARIVDLLKLEASEWLSHDGGCDCAIRGEEIFRLISLIEGKKK